MMLRARLLSEPCTHIAPRVGTSNAARPGVRTLSAKAADGDKNAAGTPKVPQPPKEAVKQQLQEMKEYKDKMTRLRRELIEGGILEQSMTKLRAKRIEEGRAKVGRKYTYEEKMAKKEERRKAHEERIAKAKAQALERHRARIKEVALRWKMKEYHEAAAFRRQQYNLALEIEAVWSRPVKEDMNLIVPVNAPFLGVLPSKHAPAAIHFADEIFKVRNMYGPPKPLPPAEDMYGGIDPRVVEYHIGWMLKKDDEEEDAGGDDAASSSRASPSSPKQ